MVKVITDTTLDLVKKNAIDKADVVSGFTLLANICLGMVEKGQFTSQTTNLFCLRAMTASIVLVGMQIFRCFNNLIRSYWWHWRFPQKDRDSHQECHCAVEQVFRRSRFNWLFIERSSIFYRALKRPYNSRNSQEYVELKILLEPLGSST